MAAPDGAASPLGRASRMMAAPTSLMACRSSTVSSLAREAASFCGSGSAARCAARALSSSWQRLPRDIERALRRRMFGPQMNAISPTACARHRGRARPDRSRWARTSFSRRCASSSAASLTFILTMRVLQLAEIRIMLLTRDRKLFRQLPPHGASRPRIFPAAARAWFSATSRSWRATSRTSAKLRAWSSLCDELLLGFDEIAADIAEPQLQARDACIGGRKRGETHLRQKLHRLLQADIFEEFVLPAFEQPFGVIKRLVHGAELSLSRNQFASRSPPARARSLARRRHSPQARASSSLISARLPAEIRRDRRHADPPIVRPADQGGSVRPRIRPAAGRARPEFPEPKAEFAFRAGAASADLPAAKRPARMPALRALRPGTRARRSWSVRSRALLTRNISRGTMPLPRSKIKI